MRTKVREIPNIDNDPEIAHYNRLAEKTEHMGLNHQKDLYLNLAFEKRQKHFLEKIPDAIPLTNHTIGYYFPGDHKEADFFIKGVRQFAFPDLIEEFQEVIPSHLLDKIVIVRELASDVFVYRLLGRNSHGPSFLIVARFGEKYYAFGLWEKKVVKDQPFSEMIDELFNKQLSRWERWKRIRYLKKHRA